MCHPTIGDLLLGLDYRILSGLRVRNWMRTGGHVLDLHGRVPGGRPGCRNAGSTRTFAGGTLPTRGRAGSVANPLLANQFTLAGLLQQHRDVIRVSSSDFLPSLAQERSDTEIFGAFYEQTGFDGHTPIDLEKACPEHALESSEQVFGTTVLASSPKKFASAGAGTPIVPQPEFRGHSFRRNRPRSLNSFRRPLQIGACGGQISTGAN